MDQYHFQYHLRNTAPIEVSEFTGSLTALSSQFEKSSGRKDARLYVHTVREGSIIVDLVEYIGVGMLNFPELAPLLVSFAETLYGKVREAMTRQPLTHWSTEDLKEIKSFAAPAVTVGNSIEIGVVDEGGNTYNNCNFFIDEHQARDVVAYINDEITARSTQSAAEDTFEELLTLTQLRGDSQSEAGTYGVIDLFGMTPKKLLFSGETKRQITEQEGNPFKKSYFVRFQVKMAGGKPKAYYILEVLDSVPID